MLDTPENQMRTSFIYAMKVTNLTEMTLNSWIHESANSYGRKMQVALLIRKLPHFNLSVGQWGWDDLTYLLP